MGVVIEPRQTDREAGRVGCHRADTDRQGGGAWVVIELRQTNKEAGRGGCHRADTDRQVGGACGLS